MIEENKEKNSRRAAIVTGSGRGIGLAIAHMLARKGMNVCLNCSTEHSLEATQQHADAIKSEYGVEAIAVCADISQSGGAEKLVNTTKETWGSVDVLVNNAGITRDGLLARMKEDDFDRVIEVNLKGAYNCCRASVPVMMKQRFGRIVNMGSIVGVCGNAGQVNYSASKAGLIGLSKSLAKEIASRNITVNVVAPGFIESDMTDKLSEKQKEQIVERIASRNLGTPEDVASLVAYLTSDEARYITGQVIGVDGGLSL